MRIRPATLRLWSRRTAVLAILIALVAGAAYGTLALTDDGPETFLVTRVIDGDTIKLEGGETVRYLLIDTPETAEEPVECYGPEATEANRLLVEGERVRLEKDVTDRDAYGRLLRYVYVDGAFVQAELVREGYAYVYSRQPDVRYLKDLAALERKARQQGLGLWGQCEGGAS